MMRETVFFAILGTMCGAHVTILMGVLKLLRPLITSVVRATEELRRSVEELTHRVDDLLEKVSRGQKAGHNLRETRRE